MRKGLKSFDDFFIKLINSKIKNKYLDKFLYRVTDLGGALFITVFCISLIIFGSTYNKKVGIEAIIALGFTQIVVHSLKRLLSRERPYKIIEQLNTFGIDLSDYSFPSGHTTASFSLATTLALNMPKFSMLVYILATIIAISRIYLGVHYPTDVTAGLIIGIGGGLITHHYLLEYVDKVITFIGIN
ncbi:phosphatase PAP2 family protein [Tissierella creatinini]|nr:phosphatase PAP2 family protein [Tissierella creatinini]TJX67496.1 phosphatase PAP2 family protein [Soehngenia saccharolytica]